MGKEGGEGLHSLLICRVSLHAKLIIDAEPGRQ